MGKRRRSVTFTVEEFEYGEILAYARIKGHGGQFPASAFAHYAVFQTMKKNPPSEAEMTKYRKTYGNEDMTQPGASAAQQEQI